MIYIYRYNLIIYIHHPFSKIGSMLGVVFAWVGRVKYMHGVFRISFSAFDWTVFSTLQGMVACLSKA